MLYRAGTKMPKHDKLGIHTTALEHALRILSMSIDAALRSREEKTPSLYVLRRNIEVLKHIVRMEEELGIISEKTYIETAQVLEAISMMANGWLKSLTQKPQN